MITQLILQKNYEKLLKSNKSQLLLYKPFDYEINTVDFFNISLHNSSILFCLFWLRFYGTKWDF
jgi:hypothetical protein